MKKTAVQQLADRFLLQSKGKAFTHAYRLAMKEAYQEATELLETEREQIEEAYDEGYKDAEQDKQTCGFCVNKKSLHLSP